MSVKGEELMQAYLKARHMTEYAHAAIWLEARDLGAFGYNCLRLEEQFREIAELLGYDLTKRGA
jgi:hypothetical protein